MKADTYPKTERVGSKSLTVTTFESGNKVWRSYDKAIAFYVSHLDQLYSNPQVDLRPMRTNDMNTSTTIKHLNLVRKVWSSSNDKFYSDSENNSAIDKFNSDLAFFSR